MQDLTSSQLKPLLPFFKLNAELFGKTFKLMQLYGYRMNLSDNDPKVLAAIAVIEPKIKQLIESVRKLEKTSSSARFIASRGTLSDMQNWLNNPSAKTFVNWANSIYSQFKKDHDASARMEKKRR